MPLEKPVHFVGKNVNHFYTWIWPLVHTGSDQQGSLY